jgi:hypothetical protein
MLATAASVPPLPSVLMALTIDLAAAGGQLSDEEMRLWASAHSAFLSSVMGELAAERRALAGALQAAGFTVRWFEELGGRDDDAERAYLAEVASSDIYVGLLCDEYGGMMADGFSATHAEFLEARRRGKRVTFWARSDGANRTGHARNFLSEVQVFQVTGSFEGAADLPERVLRRLREMAAEDVAPWVKLGDLVIRAESIRDSGRELTLTASVRDAEVGRQLDELDPARSWGRGSELGVTHGDRLGRGRVEGLDVETRSRVIRNVTVRMAVEWASCGHAMAAGTSRHSSEDLTELGVRAGLLHEPLPEGSGTMMGYMVDSTDPLAELERIAVPEGSVSAIARLLVVEQLIGSQKASSVDAFDLGPAIGGQRRVRVGWWEPRRYTNVEPGYRAVEGTRPWR